MGVITLPTTYSDGNALTGAQLNGNFSTIVNEFNGNIDNANIKAGAAIVESKIAFSTSSGHKHDGVDSAKITINRAFPWFIDYALFADATNRLYQRYIAPEDMSISEILGNVETAPVGADILVDIYINGVSIWNTNPSNRLTIADGETEGNATSFDTVEISKGDVIDIYIDQVGSTTAGAGLSVTLECEQ